MHAIAPQKDHKVIKLNVENQRAPIQKKKDAQMKKMMMSLLGISKMAYVKPCEEGFAVHGADGTELAVFSSYQEAKERISLHKLELVQVH